MLNLNVGFSTMVPHSADEENIDLACDATVHRSTVAT
jgi:hypothetical protein